MGAYWTIGAGRATSAAPKLLNFRAAAPGSGVMLAGRLAGRNLLLDGLIPARLHGGQGRTRFIVAAASEKHQQQQQPLQHDLFPFLPESPCRTCKGAKEVDCDQCKGTGRLDTGGYHRNNPVDVNRIVGSKWTAIERTFGWRHYEARAKERLDNQYWFIQLIATCDNNVRVWVNLKNLKNRKLWRMGWLERSEYTKEVTSGPKCRTCRATGKLECRACGGTGKEYASGAGDSLGFMQMEAEDEEIAPSSVEAVVGSAETGGCGASYYCPRVDFEPPPQRVYHFHHQFRQPTSAAPSNNFFKGVKWSPDGSCFLTCSEDKSLRIFDLPANALEVEAFEVGVSKEDPLSSSLTISEGETVYDFCWYPHMQASDPTTCVFATTTRDHPVHLWDAATGKLRCTYRAYDAMDEITAAISIAFNPTGSRLFCGYNKKLRVFDTSRPGRQYDEHSTLTSSKEGLTGLVSCLAFSSYTNLLAAGSYDRSVAVYNEGNMELLYVLQGHEGGLTQVLFSKDGNYLYTGGRKDRHIFCWDVRFTVGLVYKLERAAANTNQRIAFDIEPYGQHLGTGGEGGEIRFFDLQTGDHAASIQAAADTVNGFSFHSTLPLAVSTSGHRRFDNCEDEPQILTELDNCASLWRFSCSWEEIKYSGTTEESQQEQTNAIEHTNNDTEVQGLS